MEKAIGSKPTGSQLEIWSIPYNQRVKHNPEIIDMLSRDAHGLDLEECIICGCSLTIKDVYWCKAICNLCKNK